MSTAIGWGGVWLWWVGLSRCVHLRRTEDAGCLPGLSEPGGFTRVGTLRFPGMKWAASWGFRAVETVVCTLIRIEGLLYCYDAQIEIEYKA